MVNLLIKKTLNYTPFICLIASMLMLLSVYILEYIVGLIPCEMCLWQRWPHIFSSIFCILSIIILSRYSNLLIFFAGIINDVVQNFPIGVSSVNYLLLCAIAAFIRSRMVLPNLFYDWIFFLIAILIISSVNYTTLTMIFEIPIEYGVLMSNSILTFLIYPVISKIFNENILLIMRSEDD